MQFDKLCMKEETKRNGGNASLQSKPFMMMIVLVFATLILAQTTEAGNGTVQRRGFKSSLLSTAIGFGKRSPPRQPILRNNDLYPNELSSLRNMHEHSQYEANLSPLLREVNEEVSRNPHIVSLLLNAIRENEELGNRLAAYDDSQ